MGRELNMDTQRQNFWKEAITKEAYCRLNWHHKYRPDTMPERESASRQERRAARNKKLWGGVPKKPHPAVVLPTISRASGVAGKPQTAPAAVKADEGLIEMRPPSPFTRSLLYDGFTKEEKGRYQYLKARKLTIPELKYGFPLTSSWEVGWRLNDVVKDFRAPEFGRSRIVRDTFFRRNGILYDPITA